MILDNFSVVLVEPVYEGNVGSVARVMKNLGFSKLVLINPPKLDKEARARSMHGRSIMENAVILKSFGELSKRFDFVVGTTAVVGNDKNYLRTPVLPERLSRTLAVKGNIALVFGREDRGLENGEIDACDMLVSIPANPEYPTMNVSQSVGILLYELSRDVWRAKAREKRKMQELSGVEKNILMERFSDLANIALDKDFDRMLAKKTFRHVISRSFISSGEASTLIGVIKKACGKALGRKRGKPA
ncbi:MAG: RNA methyltransferase [Candidatus Altiarchaeota archaeon]|nr:RNA methyltransferase [Candidatus Altiarchaeota archaeon]